MNCSICEGSLTLHLSGVVDHMVTKESFDLYRCTNCDTLHTHPVPGSIAKYYDSQEYLSHHSEKNNLISQVYRGIRTVNINNKINILNSYAPGKKLLDVGCGTGNFLYTALQKGFQVEGVEPDEDALGTSTRKIGPVIKSSLSDIDNTFDAITLWHVLEHTPDPRAQLANLSGMLNLHGVCIIAVPNYLSQDARKYGKSWAGYDVPRHLFHFSQKSIRYLADQTNFQVADVLPMTFDAYYVSLLSEKYLGKSLLNYPRALIEGLESNYSARSTSEYSSLIYILRKQ